MMDMSSRTGLFQQTPGERGNCLQCHPEVLGAEAQIGQL